MSFASLPSPLPSAAGPRTGVWFVVGQAERGPVGKPISVQSMSDFTTKLGARQSSSILYDCLDLFFRDGGAQAFVSRVVGPSAAQATVTLQDSVPVNTLVVKAQEPGAWGNALTVTVTQPSAGVTFQLAVSKSGVLVETSPILTSVADALVWGSVPPAGQSTLGYSQYLTITSSGAGTIPAVVSNAALSTGADDAASVTDTIRVTGLTAFTADLGPGQVSIPGSTTATIYAGLVAHAGTFNRTYLADMTDTATAATLTTAVASAQAAAATAQTDPAYGGFGAPWVLIPGLPTTTSLPAPARSVPYSSFQAAAMARVDQTSGNPNLPAAGANATQGGLFTSYAIGVSQTYNDTDRASLNAAGVNVIRNIAGTVQPYGYKTGSTDPNWQQLNNQRLRMAITDDALAVSATVGEFGQIDGRGQFFARLVGAIAGRLQKYWTAGALYGATAGDAFQVSAPASLNPAGQLQAGVVKVLITTRMSPFAEQVQILEVRVPITQSIL